MSPAWVTGSDDPDVAWSLAINGFVPTQIRRVTFPTECPIGILQETVVALQQDYLGHAKAIEKWLQTAWNVRCVPYGNTANEVLHWVFGDLTQAIKKQYEWARQYDIRRDAFTHEVEPASDPGRVQLWGGQPRRHREWTRRPRCRSEKKA